MTPSGIQIPKIKARLLLPEGVGVGGTGLGLGCGGTFPPLGATLPVIMGIPAILDWLKVD